MGQYILGLSHRISSTSPFPNKIKRKEKLLAFANIDIEL